MQSRMEFAPTDPPRLGLVALVETLRLHRDLPSLPADPFQLVLWDNMGALIHDERRAALFVEFGQKVGFEPGRIITADIGLLSSIARKGGMRPEVAGRALAGMRGDRRSNIAAATWPRRFAPFRWRRRGRCSSAFPVIGDPGADKILLFAGIDAAPEHGPERPALARPARLSSPSNTPIRHPTGPRSRSSPAPGPRDRQWLMDAYLRLRAHGKTLCRRGVPLCHACPLDPACAHAPADQF